MVKIQKSDLKAIIKECLVEILSEGLGSTISEGVARRPASAGPRNRDAEPLPGRPFMTAPPRQRSHLDERAPTRQPAPQAIPPAIAAITRDPILASILADTAQTTLVEQSQGVVLGDAATQKAARLEPAQMFDEATLDSWNRAAFRPSGPGAVSQPALPVDFIHDLLKGD